MSEHVEQPDCQRSAMIEDLSDISQMIHLEHYGYDATGIVLDWSLVLETVRGL